MTILLRKKSAAEIDTSLLKEPLMSEEDWNDYKRGWQLFNDRHFWEAHEAWEAVWKRRPEESRIFFQGIIQLAAAYHLVVVKKRYGGAIRNLEKAKSKLELFPTEFLGVSVSDLLEAIGNAQAHLESLGPESIAGFDIRLIPSIDLRGLHSFTGK